MTLLVLSPQSRLAKATAKHTVELVAELADFCSDVDLGTLDRLCSLLRWATEPTVPAWSPAPPVEAHLVRGGSIADLRPWHLPLEGASSTISFSLFPLAGCQADSPLAAEWQTSVQLASPKATLRVQFPIPDLRSWPERRPWTEKAVRKESLRLDLTDVELRTELGPAGSTQLETTFSNLHGKKWPGLLQDRAPPPATARGKLQSLYNSLGSVQPELWTYNPSIDSVLGCGKCLMKLQGWTVVRPSFQSVSLGWTLFWCCGELQGLPHASLKKNQMNCPLLP